MPATFRYLDDTTVADRLPPVADLIEACAQALTALVRPTQASGPSWADLPPKMPVDVARPGAFAHGMPAAVRLSDGRLTDGRLSDVRLVGMKWISGDPERPPPRLSGLLVLEDPDVGGVRGLLAASDLTAARTAAVSMLGLRCAPPRTARSEAGEPWRVALVAGGRQAAGHRAALATVAPQASVTFVTRRDPRELPLHDGDRAVGPDRLHETIDGADVVITSVAFGTRGREIDPGRLVPGARVIATDYATAVTAATGAAVREHGPRYGPQPGAQPGPQPGPHGDVPRLITDDPAQFEATRAQGKLDGYGPADAALGALLLDGERTGRAVRERPVGTTVVVNHLGVAACDLAVGWAVLRNAEEHGAGVVLVR
ncbi:MAG: hypothetical protein WD336_10080 [Trueperaceae bacterium]